MTRLTLDTLLAGAGIVTMTVFAGGVWAAPASQADIDLCNHRAAEAAQAAKGSQMAMPRQPGAPANNPTGGRITDSTAPGSPPGASAAQPGTETGGNRTGGRITDSTQPGALTSTSGMAAVGQTDSTYRQAYVACMTERGR